MSTWMIPYDRLDTAQKNFVNSYADGRSTRNSWVCGYAGSGKSLLLVHVLKRIKEDNERRGVHKTYAVVVFTRALGDLFKTGFSELGIRDIPIMTQFELRRRIGKFDYIFCDEIQDMSKETLEMIKSKAYTVIAAGDSNQSIYSMDLMTQTDTIRGTEALTILDAEQKELNIIYRLTQSIISAVKRLMPNMARNWTAQEDLTKVDVQIELRKATSIASETDFVYNDATNCSSRGERTAVLFPKHDQILAFISRILTKEGKPQWDVTLDNFGRPNYNSLNDHLSRHGIPMMYIGNSYGSLESAQRSDKVIIMTYSSSKGLDFENVYMPCVTNGMHITHNATLDRATFMVAMTRSSHFLTISYTGTPSEYVRAFRDTCHFTDEAQRAARSNNDSIF